MIIDLTPLKAAGVSYAEFGALCKVSKVAVFKWSKGGGVDRRHAPKIASLVKAIADATAAGALPLQRIPREERQKAIAQALVKQLRKD